MKLSLSLNGKNLAIVITILVMILAADFLGFFRGMDNYCRDLSFRLRGSVDPGSRIVIAAIDEKTLKQLGRWPIGRKFYAELLDRLDTSTVVGFDIIMDEPSADDPVLNEAIRRRGRVVLPAYVQRSSGNLSRSGVMDAQRIGHVHLEQDIDGVVRKVSHTIAFGKEIVPSFSSEIFELWSGRALPREKPVTGQEVNGRILQRDFMEINFYGPPGTFPTVPMVDIINGRYPPGFFRGRILLVGMTAEGLDGGILTPFTQHRDRMTGIEAHANILGNLIDHSNITAAPVASRWIITLMLSSLGLIAFLISSGRLSFLVWVAGIIALPLASFALFSSLHFWFTPVLFVVTFSMLFIAAQIFKLEMSWRELAEARDQWEESFNAIDDAIVLMDEKGEIARMNRSARTMLEPGIVEYLRGQCRPLVDSCEKGEKADDAEQEIGGEGDPEKRRWFGIRSLPSRDSLGQCSRVVHIVRDITAKKKAGEERELLQFQLLQSQKMESIGRLAGGIAHDFNNILTVIIGCSELVLRKMEENDPQRKQLQIVQDSARKAAALIRQLLIFSRKEVMELQVVDLNRVVANMGSILERVIGEDLTLRLQTEKAVSPVMADPGHLEQVIMNLSVNARDAMPRGGTLTIETGEVHLDDEYARVHSGFSPGHFVLLTVTDTGIGMPPEVRDRIFEPFFTTKKAGQGTGLGMSTVFGIIKQMSGHIHVYSEPGKGSVFKIYLPACSGAVEEKAPTASLTLPHGTEAILIAEDEPIIRQLMLDTFTPLGYRVTVTCNGAEAMRVLDSGTRFDILLTDVVMPEMGGKELAQHFQKLHPQAKVLFMSGYTDEMIIQQGLDQQGLAFVQKPCAPSRLAIKLRRMLDGT